MYYPRDRAHGARGHRQTDRQFNNFADAVVLSVRSATVTNTHRETRSTDPSGCLCR